MSLDPWFKRLFGDDEPTSLGSGWVSGVVGVVAGLLALGGVLCFHFPALLTAPDLRPRHPIPLLRALLAFVLAVAFVASALSAVLRRRKALAATGLALATAAALLGGPAVPLPDRVASPVGLGLDWFLLDLFVLALVFVPLERALPRDPAQLVFRPGWSTDGVHFLASHLAVQLFSFLALAPGQVLQRWVTPGALSGAVAALPLPLQVVGVALIADTAQYFVHRAFHRVPVLWRFHAVHHSSEALDWLAGSRMHLLDALLTRALTLLPVLLLGFSGTAIGAYLVFVSFHAVFIHANVGARLAWLEPFLVTPRIHHFHHAAEPEAIDKNFAVHLPVLDRLFGTRYLPPDRWPTAYGLAGERLPDGWLGQLAAPFRRRRS